MGLYANINGTQKIIKNMYYNSDGAKRTLSSMYANVNATEKKIFAHIYTWAKYKVVNTPSIRRSSGSWQFATSSGLGNFYCCTNIYANGTNYALLYPDGERLSLSYNGLNNGNFNGYYLMATGQITNDSGHDSNGNGLIPISDPTAQKYAYRISGCDSNVKIDGVWYDWLIKFNQELQAYVSTSENFVGYVTSTDRSTYKDNVVTDGYKYVFLV